MTPGHPENFETKGIEVTTGERIDDAFFSFFFLFSFFFALALLCSPEREEGLQIERARFDVGTIPHMASRPSPLRLST